MIAESARDVPAWSSRSASPTLSIARALEKLQSALQKSRIDRATTCGPPWAEIEHWDEAVRCLSVDPVLSGGVVYMGTLESSTALGGFRVLKRTPEAPYTTKVNSRM